MGISRRRRLLTFFTLVCALWSLSLFAQSTTAGSVTGSVIDEQGAAIPGVTVDLRGPAMQGVRTAVTDGKGEYRFSNVPPGLGYDLTATLSGFQTQTQQNFRVYLGKDAHYDITLRAAVSEAITVTAAAPLVDVTRTTTGVNITTEQFENLPTARTFQQLTTLAPGVVMEMGESRTGQLANSPNVGASSAPENNYIIDGLSTTDARYGTSGTNLTMNFVEEVQVMTGGYSAEYGRSTGGVFNVITKSGGNEFHGDVYAYISEASWSDERTTRFQKGTSVEASLTDSQDMGLAIGGPILRDRLWFFGAYNPSRKTIDVGTTRQPDGSILGDDATEYDADTDFYAGKLTFSATPNHNFVLTAFGDPTTLEGWLYGRTFTEIAAEEGAAVRKQETGSDNIALRYTGIITQTWLFEASAGRHEKDYTLAPATEVGRTVPRQVDETLAGGFQRGGFQRIQGDDATRDAFALKMTNFLGSHELRYGIDFEYNEYNADLHETWFRHFGVTGQSRFRDECAGVQCVYIQERQYEVAGSGETDNEAIFLQDQWKVLPNLQLNLGVRYEEQTITSANGVLLGDDLEDAIDYTFDRVDEYKFDDNWAPRLGVVWDPMNNGHTKIYAFAGRFYEAMPLDMNIRAVNGESYIINYYQHEPVASNPGFWYNPSGSPIPASVISGPVGGPASNGWKKFRSVPLVNETALDSEIKMQYQDEYILGGEYQFGAVWSVGLRLVQRDLERVIEDFGTFADVTDPTLLTAYVIGNPGEGLYGAPYDKPSRRYQAAELTLQRAFANNWQVYASYVYAKGEGNHEGLFMSGYEQLDPNITALYDIPSFLPNADGKLRADRPYIFKVHSSYAFPFGLNIGEGFYYSAGAPYSALGPELTNGYGDGTIFLQTRGDAGRTPSYWSLDLHADYMLPFFRSSAGGISLILDILNVTDNDEAIEFDQDYIYEAIVTDQGDQYAGWFEDDNLDSFGNPLFNAALPASQYWGTPALLQAPRTFQVGVKFTY